MSNLRDFTFIDDFGDLCLNESDSDVVFHIGDTQVPAHEFVLVQRSPVFRKMFIKEDGKFKNQSIMLTATPLEAFKQFLKFIYTGVIDFDKLLFNVVKDIVELAFVYEVTQLKEWAIEHLEA
uniref:BTB domain-containing protein n=1 Tax=Panagrellus redivivus TaxID=6233 RepID=A0A7E4ZU24_PANRE